MKGPGFSPDRGETIKINDEESKGGRKKTNFEIDISDVNQSVRNLIEDLESEHEVYGDETVQRATLKCLKHLQEKKELSHRDLKMNVYLDFLDESSADLKRDIRDDIKEASCEDLWEMGKAGLDHLEKNTNFVESSLESKNKRYKWNSPKADMSPLDEKNSEEKSLEDANKQRLIESGKNFLRAIYDEKDKNEISALENGKSYIIKEKRPEKGLELSLKAMEKEENGYILSSINPKEIKREYDTSLDFISYNWLTVLEGKNRFNPSNLHLIGHSMIDFLEEENGPIFMEGIEIILKHNSFDRFWGFLNHLIDVVSEEDGILVLSFDPETLSDRQLAKIERKLEVL